MSERKLYIGNLAATAGWEVCTRERNVTMEHPDRIFNLVYATNLGQLDANSQALWAMREWLRVIVPGGVLVVVVADIAAVGAAINASSSVDDHIFLTHLIGRSSWTAETIETYLSLAGFTNVRRSENLEFFSDVSAVKFRGKKMGLCVLADKPR